MTNLIEVQNLTKTYTMGDVEVQAQRGISLTITEGEMVAIMGPSGSGKSTLMNIIGCLDQPSDGSYLLDGVDVGSLSDSQLAAIRNQKIGFVFQQYMLLQRTSALRNVELPLLYGGGGDRRERAVSALRAVGMSEQAGQFAQGMWAALDGEGHVLERLSFTGEGSLPSAFHVTDLAAASNVSRDV